MYYATKEEYEKAYKKQFDCLYKQLKEEGYDLEKQISKEESNLYNNEYKIIKTHWNSFPNEEFSQVVHGVIQNEINKSECKNFELQKSNFKNLGYEIGSYDSILEYYFNEKENTLLIYLYEYDTYKPNSKSYKRHPKRLSVVYEAKISGEIN